LAFGEGKEGSWAIYDCPVGTGAMIFFRVNMAPPEILTLAAFYR